MPEDTAAWDGFEPGRGRRLTGNFHRLPCGGCAYAVQPNAQNPLRSGWVLGIDLVQPSPEEKPMHAFTRCYRMILVLAVALVCVASRPVTAQEKSAESQAAPTAQPRPEAKPADVSSPDAILAATYDVISGPPGERDWNRFYSLFIPDARLIAAGKDKDGSIKIHSVTPEGYAKLAGDYFKTHGFFERESSRKAERYGNIMQIFSTYESRNTKADEKPFARGINSFQLYNDGKRWWVVTIYWLEESSDNPLPKEYLPQ
jgi:hypothetical protein